MKTYGYASVSYDGTLNAVYLYCIDSHLIDWLLAELKKAIPNYRLAESAELPPGQMYYCYIDRLRGRGRDIWWWIIRQLCERGWEPFSEQGGEISFRLKREELEQHTESPAD